MAVHVMTHMQQAGSVTSETINSCIRLTCQYCANGVPITRYDGDDNYYHDVASPCKAHAIRRAFNIDGRVAGENGIE